MSMFNFTRQEQLTILFLAFALLVGGVITLIKRHSPGFAPELHLTGPIHTDMNDTISTADWTQRPEPLDTLPSAKVDINRATAEELMALPGIGPKMARRIIAHRDLSGAFRTISDLKEVNGIGDKTFERLRPFIKID